MACLAITGVSLIAPGNEALAEKSSNKKSSKRKSYVLSPAIFKKMGTIHKLLEEEKFTEALALLEQLAKKKKLSSFETATVFQAFGFAYSSLSQYAKAAENFEKSLATDALHDQTLVNMRYNLAQLYMAEEEFPKAIAHLEQWLEMASKPGPQGYYLLGAAHAQLGEAKQALPYVLKAVSSEPKFKESWQQLLLALHFELKQFNKAAEVLATLIEHEPKKSYLQQLQGIYSELGDEKKALAVMELSYRQGYLDSSSELRNLAHLYLYHEVPSLAAQVMVKGLAEGTIKGERKSWELLGDSWIHAREYKRALEPLHKAAELAEDGDVHLKLARIHLEDQDWKQARVSIEAALAKGELDNPGDAQLMLGISNAKTGRFDAARKAFRKASQSKSSQKSAASWLEHVDALEAAAAREH
ncbi:MAG: tetratricopeptide repeat protein [bacterium]|nr:tetratricopeptide repeat protein [bacterium]